MITAILCTKRKEPQFDWMADSLVRALNDAPYVPFELIVVDGLLWADDTCVSLVIVEAARRARLAHAVNGRFPYRHVPPKPTAWQGPTRKTKKDYFALCNARNTGIALARGSHLVFFDDCTVLDESWLAWHWRVAQRRAAMAGSFRSYTRAKVEGGRVVNGELHPIGEDSRGQTTMQAPGGWLYGLNMSFPLEYALRINGYDEQYDGQAGSEDCLAFSTEILTSEGLKPIGELADHEVTLLTTHHRWVKAPIRKFGRSRLWRLVCRNGHGHEKEIYCTDNHKWFVKTYDKTERNVHVVSTADLQPETHRLVYLLANNALTTKTVPSPFGIAHGIAFGDGCHEKPKTSGKVGLHGEKRELARFFLNCATYPTKCDGEVFSGLPNYFKALPNLQENTSYLLGWVMGYFAADGHVSEQGAASLASTSYAAVKHFRDACLILGLECYPIREEHRDTNFKNDSTLYKTTLGRHSLSKDFFLRSKHRKRFHENTNTQYTTTKLNEWKIISVEPTDRVEDTYCAVVPETHAFVIEGNILTHNCDFGVRLHRAGCPIVYEPRCLIFQILETHEAVCDQATWGEPQIAKQKELVLKRDGKPHFANEALIERLQEDEGRVMPLGNDFDLRRLRAEALATGNFPTERAVEVDWRDEQRLEDM